MNAVFTKSAILLCAITISACSSTPSSGRYSHKYDSAPSRVPTPDELRDAVPSDDAINPDVTRDYELFGEFYDVLDSAKGFVQEGIASWYGRKFHGHMTSNGEFYDMYSMTAAHKRLPLPTYVRVTNLNNQRSVVVRVNDRGPFHSDRVIDLSYVAAYKLDMLSTGTAPVRIEAIDPAAYELAPQPSDLAIPAPAPDHEEALFYIQVAASSNLTKIRQLGKNLRQTFNIAATTEQQNGLHKLLLGPIPASRSQELLQSIRVQGYPGAFRVPAQPADVNSPES
ncbi:septal ring lytic transglycosylase RlpA [Idiomarina tyrosinivorans]|uniref:Endolytic peptidoglycan transglycosylase RlpA n=1 Tax=Idiomarina tyrosinivorans TaxID=1445662 RepID=A0A432ZRB5_9GAMM|nr:septal ring lytic transglycosylase RlpA family protein [Idiomarina tyrosinivorans]RUO80447.1 septal ring lytic transglycosylase RlpA [Idiomarina tyrosinivorans]